MSHDTAFSFPVYMHLLTACIILSPPSLWCWCPTVRYFVGSPDPLNSTGVAVRFPGYMRIVWKRLFTISGSGRSLQICQFLQHRWPGSLFASRNFHRNCIEFILILPTFCPTNSPFAFFRSWHWLRPQDYHLHQGQELPGHWSLLLPFVAASLRCS